jgi:hypothetical protein
MKRSSAPRTTANLADSVQLHLNMYVLAASAAAGAGMLALAQPVEAKIIYTYANKKIGPMTFLDLNHDGVHDFKFVYTHVTNPVRRGECSASTSGKLVAYGVRPANRILGQSLWASALPAGSYIGPEAKFLGKEMARELAACGDNFRASGFWAIGDGKNRYLGLRFTLEGKIHFGWARVNVVITQDATIQATLSGYAYETIPGKLIVAGRKKGPADEQSEEDFGSGASLTDPIPETPQTASLGVLALGAQGVPLWRRKQSAFERQDTGGTICRRSKEAS